MPKYQFEAMDRTGQEIRDFIEAPSQEEAQKTIRDMGYFVTKISVVKLLDDIDLTLDKPEKTPKPTDQENLKKYFGIRDRTGDMGYFVTKLSESEKPIDQENLNSMRIQKKHEKQNCPEVFCHIDWFVYRFIDSCIATWVCECWSNHIL